MTRSLARLTGHDSFLSIHQFVRHHRRAENERDGVEDDYWARSETASVDDPKQDAERNNNEHEKRNVCGRLWIVMPHGPDLGD